MAKKKYWVDPNRVLEHDGERVEGGQSISLDDATAQSLLNAGILMDKQPVEEVKADLATVSAERDALKADLEKATKELEKANKEIEKLKADLEKATKK